MTGKYVMRTVVFAGIVCVFGILASCDSSPENWGYFRGFFHPLLKQANGCEGCLAEATGMLRVENDSAVSLTGIFITQNLWFDNEPNQLADPLPPGWALEKQLQRGFWSVGIVDELGKAGIKDSVMVMADTTVTVRVSEIMGTTPDVTRPEGEEEDPGTNDPEGEDDGSPSDVVDVIETSTARELEGGSSLHITMSDGAQLTFPALPCEGTITTVTLETVETALDLSAYEVTPVGQVRDLTFESFDPMDHNLYTADFVPTLTIPAAELTGIDKAALVVMRIGDLYLTDEEQQPGRAHYLPVTFTESGDLQVADFYMADSIISDIILRDAPPAKQRILHPRRIRYVPALFSGSYNYSMEPSLQRFYPVSDSPYRASFDELDSDRQEAEKDKNIKNIVVLVHGYHNHERLGQAPATARAPWHYDYKCHVWNLFYNYFQEYRADTISCTAFYEYIYPTYRPIFTPGAGSRLDEDFADRIQDLVREYNALSFMPGNTEVRLYIVAHSMGGVVSRAGIQLFDAETHDAFQKLVTWGTPYLGTPLLSLRRVLSAPNGIYSIRRGLVNVPLGNIDNTLYVYRRVLEYFIPDSPGIRDLQWARSHTTTTHNLRFEDYFSFDVNAAVETALLNQYDLFNGTEIFNRNLNTLNTEDVYRLDEKYHAVYGINNNRPTITTSRWWWPKVEGVARLDLGATVIPWLMKDPTQSYEGGVRGDSDGMIPLASMMGGGTTVAWRRSEFNDTNHEAYFGYPDASGEFREESKAMDVAQETLRVLDLEPCAVELLLNINRQGTTMDGVQYTLTAEVRELPPDTDHVAFAWDFGDGRVEAQGGSVAAVSNGKAEITVNHVYAHVSADMTFIVTVSVTANGLEIARETVEVSLIAHTVTVTINEIFVFDKKLELQRDSLSLPDPTCEPWGMGDNKFYYEGCVTPDGLFPSYEYRWGLRINQDDPSNFTRTSADSCNVLDGWYTFDLTGDAYVTLEVYAPDGQLLGSDTKDTNLTCWPW